MHTKKRFSIQEFLINNAIIIILLILAIFASISNKEFLSIKNFVNIGVNSAPRFLIALGVSGCLITRGTDLSAGRLVGLAACVAGTLLQSPTFKNRFYPNLPHLNILVVLLITMGACAIFGALNGVVISKLKVPPFIATLGMQTIVYGIARLYVGTSVGSYRDDYKAVGSGSFLHVPYMVWIALLAGALMWFLYNKTRHGKGMYAIGGNPQAAEVSGVKVDRSLILIYTLAACLYAIGGFVLGAVSGGAKTDTGSGYELEAIAACTIGGVSTQGGVGKVSGILVGVLVFEVLKVCLQFIKVRPDYQFVLQGMVIIVAVSLDLRKYLVKK